MLHFCAIFFATFGGWDGGQATTTEPLKVSGEYVLAVKSLPVTIHAPSNPNLKFISWHAPRTAVVEVRNDRRDLVVMSLPQGESYFWGDFGTVGPDGEVSQFIQGVTLLNGQLPRPPPDPNKPDPEPEPDDGPKQTVIVQDTVLPNAPAEAAAEELRTQDGESVFFVNAGADGTKPAWLQTACDKAEEIGYPALVVMKGQTVALAEKLPNTKQRILDAVRGVE